jgi:hypothetical protein
VRFLAVVGRHVEREIEVGGILRAGRRVVDDQRRRDDMAGERAEFAAEVAPGERVVGDVREVVADRDQRGAGDAAGERKRAR